MVKLSLSFLFAINLLKRGALAGYIIDVYTEPGGNVTLNCSFSGGLIQWMLQPEPSGRSIITISENKAISPVFHNHYKVTDGDTYNLQIVNATNFTEGKYSCHTTFSHAEADSFHYFYLHLKVPPSEVKVVHMTEKNTIIGTENDNLTLACYTLGGIPRSKTIWYHGKKKLSMNKDDSEWAYYSLILNRKHNKQIFTCIADHDMLRTPLNQSIKLDIQYHPRVQCLWPKGSVSVGHHVNLSCSYYSNPIDAEILWTKNGQNIDYSHSIVTKIAVENYRKWTEIELMTIDAHGVTAIIIANVTKADAGAYTCNVTNTEGSASETAYLVVQDNDSETVSHSIPPYSGTSVKGFSMKEQMIYGVIVVLVEVVLIIISLVGHAYIRFRCKQTNYPVPQTDVVRQISFEIEMRDITSTEDDVNEELRNQQLSTNHQNASVDDRQGDWSTTNSRSSSLHSNISQNMNEDDYLHPYHSFVQSRMDVHEYAIVDRKATAEYEEIANVQVSKDQIGDYENTKL